MYKKWLVWVFLALFSVGSVWAQETIADCVTAYDSTVDYFPDKMTVDYATGFTIEYHNHYKVVTVLAPFPNATDEDGFTYVLVHCGTPAPEGYEGATVLEVPTGKVITMSTTFLPHLRDLQLLEQLVGVDSLLYTSTPEVLEMGEAGELVEIGFGSGLNVELVLETDPDLVLVNASGTPEYDAHPVLLSAGVPFAVGADYVEKTPLGSAEWIKFTASFYNKDAEAQALFDETATRYNDLVALVATSVPAEERPTLLWDAFSAYSSTWFVPGENTYVNALIQDAGATLILGDSPEVLGKDASVPFDFEVVYEAGVEADVWIINSFTAGDLAGLLAQDDRYADFVAFQNEQVFNNGVRVNANGGNDYYENGINQPDVLLADLIRLIHPNLLPDYTPVYFQRLQ